jgi:hypothetical protein
MMEGSELYRWRRANIFRHVRLSYENEGDAGDIPVSKFACKRRVKENGSC